MSTEGSIEPSPLGPPATVNCNLFLPFVAKFWLGVITRIILYTKDSLFSNLISSPVCISQGILGKGQAVSWGSKPPGKNGFAEAVYGKYPW